MVHWSVPWIGLRTTERMLYIKSEKLRCMTCKRLKWVHYKLARLLQLLDFSLHRYKRYSPMNVP